MTDVIISPDGKKMWLDNVEVTGLIEFNFSHDPLQVKPHIELVFEPESLQYGDVAGAAANHAPDIQKAIQNARRRRQSIPVERPVDVQTGKPYEIGEETDEKGDPEQ